MVSLVCIAPGRVDVQAAANVLDAGHQFHRRVVTVNARQRDVRQLVMPVRGGAENALHEVVEQAVIIFLLLEQGGLLVLAFHGAADDRFQRAFAELFLGKILLGAGPDHLHGERLVMARPKNHHRQGGRLGGEERDLKQPGGIGGGQFKQNNIKRPVRQICQPGIQRQHGDDFNGLPLVAELSGHGAGETLVAGNQQHLQ
jgi:hypothetical protein